MLSCLGSVPGNVTAAKGEHSLVSCDASVLTVTEIQRPDGKRMAVGAWLRGGRVIVWAADNSSRKSPFNIG